MRMSEKELKDVNGGSISLTTGILIVSLAAFLIGVLEGFLRPSGCNDAT